MEFEILKLTQNGRTKSNDFWNKELKSVSPLLKIRHLTGQESVQIYVLWTLPANLSSVNSKEPFDVCHYLSKTLRLVCSGAPCAREARVSGEPSLRQFGKISIREILVMTSAYFRPYGLSGQWKVVHMDSWGRGKQDFVAGNSMAQHRAIIQRKWFWKRNFKAT